MIVIDKITGRSFRTEEDYQRFNMSKKEQLKEVFTKEVKELINRHDSTLADNTNIEVKDTVNTLLKEVTIRTNL